MQPVESNRYFYCFGGPNPGPSVTQHGVSMFRSLARLPSCGPYLAVRLVRRTP